MSLTLHPRLLARIAGAFYLIITVCALFAYLYVRGEIIFPDDMAKTMANVVGQEHLYRLGFSAAVIVVVSNLPMGVILYELLKIVNARLALLALVFIIASTLLEAVNLMNYIQPLFTFTLPEIQSAFGPGERQALARLPIRMWGYAFSVSLTFFGVFCTLIGYLILRSTFLPRIIGALMMAAGVCYWLSCFGLFLALPEIPYLFRVTFAAENSLALWLLIVGVNETKWRAQAGLGNATAVTLRGAGAGARRWYNVPAMTDFAVPSLPMRDARETRAFYESLGFICAHEQPPPDSFLYMVRNGVYVQFYIAPGVDVRLIEHVFSVYVDDLEATYAAFKAADPPTLMPIEHKPWGFPEFALVDPNGNLMRVASPKFEIK